MARQLGQTGADAVEASVAVADLPPEAFLRRDNPFLFERGGIVYAADGRVGVLRQIVVDQDAGLVSELIVTPDGRQEPVVVPVVLVAKTGGSAVVLSLHRAEFADRTGETPGYERRQFKKASLRTLRRNGKEAVARSRRLAVLEASQDRVTTPAAGRA